METGTLEPIIRKMTGSRGTVRTRTKARTTRVMAGQGTVRAAVTTVGMGRNAGNLLRGKVSGDIVVLFSLKKGYLKRQIQVESGSSDYRYGSTSQFHENSLLDMVNGSSDLNVAAIDYGNERNLDVSQNSIRRIVRGPQTSSSIAETLISCRPVHRVLLLTF